MMNKFWFLVSNSFLKKVKSKWFIIVNLILAIAIIGIINIDSIIKMFGGDFNDTYEVLVLDNTNYSSKVFKDNLLDYNDKLGMDFDFNIEVKQDSLDSLKEEIKDTNKVLIVINENPTSFIDASIISNSTIDTAYYQLLYQALTGTKETISLSLTNIDRNELTKLMNPINIDREILNSDKTGTDEQMEMVMGSVFPTVILPVFILVILLVQMIGAEINEEKQTRSMEVIISNVSPKVHFFSKMIASNGFVIMQGALLILYSVIALTIKNHIGLQDTSSITKGITDIWNTLKDSGFIDKLYYIAPITLVLMVLSFIVYSLLAGILASMTVSMEDYQQIQTPIVMILLLGYYLSIMAGMFNGSILIKVLSYVPLISCLLSPALLVIGEVGIIDIIISIFTLLVFIFILVRYGLRIYKIGILNYSTDKMWKKIFKAVRNKES